MSAGFGTNGVATGGGINERNFLGKGINLSTNISISEDSIKGNFDYVNPNFKNSDKSLIDLLGFVAMGCLLVSGGILLNYLLSKGK